jgi:hypothetical protein
MLNVQKIALFSECFAVSECHVFAATVTVPMHVDAVLVRVKVNEPIPSH